MNRRTARRVETREATRLSHVAIVRLCPDNAFLMTQWTSYVIRFLMSTRTRREEKPKPLRPSLI